MAKQVKRIEVSEEDLFRDIRLSSAQAEEEIKQLNVELNITAKILQKDLASALVKDTKSLNEFSKSILGANKLMKDAITLDERRVKAIEQGNRAQILENKARQEKIKTEILEQRQAQQLEKAKLAQAKAEEKAAKAAAMENNAYQQLSKTTREHKNESKRLAVELMNLERSGGRNTKAFKDMERQYHATTRAAKMGDAQLKRIDATVGDNFRNVGNYEGAIGKLTGALTKLGVGFGAFQVIRGSFNILKDFDEGAADIAKTTGLTTERTKALSEELLKIDTKTAVNELQGLAAAAGRLNVSGEGNIISFVKAADQAFVALGDDLDGTAEEIATNVGKIAGVFGDEKKFGIGPAIMKVGSAINELAGKSKAAAGPILDFTQRMAGLGNLISSADTAALGAFFDEGGQSVEVASSTLNTLLPKMAENYKEFAKTAGMSAEEFKKLAEKSPIEALKAVASGAKNSEKGLFNLAKTVESFGVESARATSIVGFLSANTDRLTELQKISNDAFSEGTSLTNEFNTKNETLGATWEKLTKAVDTYVISADSATGASSFLKNSLGFIADNFKSIMSVMGKMAIAFGVYKARMAGINLLNKAFGDGTEDVNRSLKNLKGNLTGAQGGLKGLGSVIKGIGWTALAAAVTDFAMQLYDIGSGAAYARFQLDRLNKSTEEGTAAAGEYLEKLNQQNKENIQDIDKRLSLNQITEKQAVAQRLAETKRHKERITEKIIELRALKDEAIIRGSQAKKALDDYNNSLTVGVPLTVESAKKQGELRLAHTNQAMIVKGLTSAILELKTANSETADATVDLEIEQNNLNKTTGESINKAKELNAELEKQNEYLSKQTELLEALDALNAETEGAQVQVLIDEAISNLGKIASETGQLDVDLLEQLLDRKYEIIKADVARRLDFEIDSIQEKYRIEAEIERTKLEENRAKLLEQKGLSEAQKIEIDKQYQEQLRLLEMDELQRAADLELEIRLLKGNANNELVEIEKSKNEEINQVNDELIDKQIEFAEKQGAELVEKDKEVAKERMDIAKLLSDYLIKESEKRISQLEKEIDAAQKQSDHLMKLAEEGNINASQSIAEQQKIINEANKKKLEEEKRQQRIKLAASVYSTYQQKTEQGVEHPLTETIRDITLLQQFIEALPAFEKGIENTGANGKGVDGKGGFHAILHPFERVVPAEENAQLGDISNAELPTLARIGQDYINKKAMSRQEGAVQIGGWDSSAMLNKLDGIEKAIQNKPVPDWKVDEVVDKVLLLTKTTRQGNNIYTHRFRKDS